MFTQHSGCPSFLKSKLAPIAMATFLASFFFVATGRTVGAAARVELTIATEAGVGLTEPQEWMRALGRVGVKARLRGARGDDMVEIVKEGTAASPLYRVTGVLTSKGLLRVPGRSFRVTEGRNIKTWIDTLAKEGLPGEKPKPAAFGLMPQQLVDLHKDLAVGVHFSTKGVTPKEVIRKIAAGIKPRIVIDPAIRKSFEDEWVIPEEMKGLSSGTVLAAVVRPLGLVVIPVKNRTAVDLYVRDAQNAGESWPIGWPKPAGKTTGRILPDMLKMLPVEIADTPLTDVLDAIGTRLDVPMLMDHNSMVRQRIDPKKTNVSFPSKTTFYKRVLDNVLFQAKLKSELRMDEAEKPFFWIVPLRKK